MEPDGTKLDPVTRQGVDKVETVSKLLTFENHEKPYNVLNHLPKLNWPWTKLNRPREKFGTIT